MSLKYNIMDGQKSQLFYSKFLLFFEKRFGKKTGCAQTCDQKNQRARTGKIQQIGADQIICRLHIRNDSNAKEDRAQYTENEDAKQSVSGEFFMSQLDKQTAQATNQLTNTKEKRREDRYAVTPGDQSKAKTT